ncbi:MAG: hypothetical protein V4674_02810 [Patescibacteria group bacterium]
MKRIRPERTARGIVFGTEEDLFSCTACSTAIQLGAYGVAVVIDEIEYPLPAPNIVCPACGEALSEVPATYATLKEASERVCEVMDQLEDEETIEIAEPVEIRKDLAN